MNNKQITTRYNRIVKLYEGKDPGGVNCYRCPQGHITKTIDKDPGVTPFLHLCHKCGDMATSSFYNDTHPDIEPVEEWYRPSLKKVLKMKKDQQMLDHILNGGLDVRKIKKNG